MVKLSKYHEQIAYIFFGIITTLVSWGVYTLFINLGVRIEISNTISWIAAVTVAFFTNKWWVFKSSAEGFKAVFKEGLAFLESRILTGVLELVLVPLLVRIGFDGLIFSTIGFDARIIVSVLVVIGNYFISKFWVFKKDSKAENKMISEELNDE